MPHVTSRLSSTYTSPAKESSEAVTTVGSNRNDSSIVVSSIRPGNPAIHYVDAATATHRAIFPDRPDEATTSVIADTTVASSTSACPANSFSGHAEPVAAPRADGSTEESLPAEATPRSACRHAAPAALAHHPSAPDASTARVAIATGEDYWGVGVRGGRCRGPHDIPHDEPYGDNAPHGARVVGGDAQDESDPCRHPQPEPSVHEPPHQPTPALLVTPFVALRGRAYAFIVHSEGPLSGHPPPPLHYHTAVATARLRAKLSVLVEQRRAAVGRRSGCCGYEPFCGSADVEAAQHITREELAHAIRLPGVLWRHDPYSSVVLTPCEPPGSEAVAEGDGWESLRARRARSPAPTRVEGGPCCTPEPAASLLPTPTGPPRFRRFVSALAGEAAGYSVGAITATYTATAPPARGTLSATVGDTPEGQQRPCQPKTAAAAAAAAATPLSAGRPEREEGEITPSARPRPAAGSRGLLRSYVIGSHTATPPRPGPGAGGERAGPATTTGGAAAPAALSTSRARDGLSLSGDSLSRIGPGVGAERASAGFPIPRPRHTLPRQHRQGSPFPEAAGTDTPRLPLADRSVSLNHMAASWASKLRGQSRQAGAGEDVSREEPRPCLLSSPAWTRGATHGAGGDGEPDPRGDPVDGGPMQGLSPTPTPTPTSSPAYCPQPMTSATIEGLLILGDAVYRSGYFVDAVEERQRRIRSQPFGRQRGSDRGRPVATPSQEGAGRAGGHGSHGRSGTRSCAAGKSLRAPEGKAGWFYVLQHRCRTSLACGAAPYEHGTLVVVDGDMGIELGVVIASCSSAELNLRIAEGHSGNDTAAGRGQAAGALRVMMNLTGPDGRGANATSDQDTTVAHGDAANEAVLLSTRRHREEALKAFVYRCATEEEAYFYYGTLVDLEQGTLAFLLHLKAEVTESHGGGLASLAASTGLRAGRWRSPGWRSDALASAESLRSCRIDLMDFIACEFQADGQKLYVYYQTEHPVRFLGLATFLYHIFHCRIWFHQVPSAKKAMGAADGGAKAPPSPPPVASSQRRAV